MNKILKTLAENCWKSNKKYYEVKGNYKIAKIDNIINHLYYNHLICTVDLEKKQFYLDFCGYNGYRLTIAQINFLEKFYKEKGFELVKVYD